MNADTTRDRLQQVADAAMAGNRLMARLKLQSAMETAAEHPAAWIWQAWAAGSPSEAIASLQHALSIGAEHPMIEAGLEWLESLEQLAAGEIDVATVAQMHAAEQTLVAEQIPTVEQTLVAEQRSVAEQMPVRKRDPEAELLSSLTAIRDEVFAALHANPPHDLDDLQAILRPSVVREFRSYGR